MKIEYIEKDNTLHITITVLIVEDNQDKAFTLKGIIEKYQSHLDSKFDIWGRKIFVTYQAIINGTANLEYNLFSGRKAVTASWEFIQSNDVDIVLCDHDLKGNTKDGHQLLEELYEHEKNSNKRIYKVLHSVQPQYQKYQDKPFVNKIYNANDVEVADEIILSTYEEAILIPKLFGNPAFHTLFFESYTNQLFRIKNTTYFTELSIKGVLPWQVLYAYSISKGLNRIKYVTDRYSLDKVEDYFSLKEYFDNELFIKISDALYINKLWFADYDITSNMISCLVASMPLHSFSLSEIQQRKKTTLNLITYLNSLFNQQQKPELPVFTLNRYFKLLSDTNS